MTLNTARKIETAFRVVIFVAMLPFTLVGQIFEWLKRPFVWIGDMCGLLAFKVGHKLMHMSDAVKDGTIKNPYCLRNYTALIAWRHLKEAEQKGKEADK